jgi:hypothetical protein
MRQQKQLKQLKWQREENEVELQKGQQQLAREQVDEQLQKEKQLKDEDVKLLSLPFFHFILLT